MDAMTSYKLNEIIDVAKTQIEAPSNDFFIAYHYTSFDGLTGILREKAINPVFYFSRYDALNDISEGYDIIEIFNECIEELIEKKRISKEFCDSAVNISATNIFLFGENIKDFVIPSTGESCDCTKYYSRKGKAYICSFSAESDSLPMWNYYCKEDQSKSYNIGIMTELFENRYNAFGNGYVFNLFKIIYDNRTKKDIIRNLIESVYKVYQDDNVDIEEILEYITGFLNVYRFAFKKECFSHECEYRAILIIPDENLGSIDIINRYPIKFRNVSNTIVPYIEYEWKECNVVEVNFGPSDNDMDKKESKKEILNELLSKRGWGGIKIGYSNIPVRY